MVHTCTISTWEVETAGSKVQGYCWLHSEVQTSLGYMESVSSKQQQQQSQRKSHREPFLKGSHEKDCLPWGTYGVWHTRSIPCTGGAKMTIASTEAHRNGCMPSKCSLQSARARVARLGPQALVCQPLLLGQSWHTFTGFLVNISKHLTGR